MLIFFVTVHTVPCVFSLLLSILSFAYFLYYCPYCPMLISFATALCLFSAALCSFLCFCQCSFLQSMLVYACICMCPLLISLINACICIYLHLPAAHSSSPCLDMYTCESIHCYSSIDMISFYLWACSFPGTTACACIHKSCCHMSIAWYFFNILPYVHDPPWLLIIISVCLELAFGHSSTLTVTNPTWLIEKFL